MTVLLTCLCSSNDDLITITLIYFNTCMNFTWNFMELLFLFSHFPSSLQKDELDDIPIELSKVQSVKVSSHTLTGPHDPDP